MLKTHDELWKCEVCKSIIRRDRIEDAIFAVKRTRA
jgi:hypothetical protein